MGDMVLIIGFLVDFVLLVAHFVATLALPHLGYACSWCEIYSFSLHPVRATGQYALCIVCTNLLAVKYYCSTVQILFESLVMMVL